MHRLTHGPRDLASTAATERHHAAGIGSDSRTNLALIPIVEIDRRLLLGSTVGSEKRSDAQPHTANRRRR
jgi:hypothetical protein